MKKVIVFVCFFIVLFANSNFHLPEQCFNELVANPSCAWYLLCLQEKYQCGKNGYPVGYGYKYCQKFNSLKSYPEVEEWVGCTTKCLKTGLIFTLEDRSQYNCKQLKTVAFNTHPYCYESCGFCKLWRQLGTQKFGIFLDELLKIYEVKDFESITAIRQIEEVLSKCIL